MLRGFLYAQPVIKTHHLIVFDFNAPGLRETLYTIGAGPVAIALTTPTCVVLAFEHIQLFFADEAIEGGLRL